VKEGEHDEHGLGLSEVGYQFTAGLLRHLPAITAVSAPTVCRLSVTCDTIGQE
jgi:glutamine synthetase